MGGCAGRKDLFLRDQFRVLQRSHVVVQPPPPHRALELFYLPRLKLCTIELGCLKGSCLSFMAVVVGEEEKSTCVKKCRISLISARLLRPTVVRLEEMAGPRVSSPPSPSHKSIPWKVLGVEAR